MSDTGRRPPTQTINSGIYGAQLATLLNGGAVAQALSVAAELGIADALAGGPMTAVDLAEQLGTDPDATTRLLRALTSSGVFQETPEGEAALAPVGQVLRSGVDGSLRDYAIFVGREWHRAWGELLGAVRSGTPAFELAFGTSFYDYLASNPESDARWSRYLEQSTDAMIFHDAVLDELDLRGDERIVDLGGGKGAMLAALLVRHPGATGVLVDLPFVVSDAHDVLDQQGVADRCEVIGGSFFDGVPPGGDVYLLARVVSNWEDDAALALLTDIRSAIAPGGRVFAVEGVVPDDGRPHFTKIADLGNLMIGGRLRTGSAWRALLGGAGFEEVEIRTTKSVVFSVVEGRAPGDRSAAGLAATARDMGGTP